MVSDITFAYLAVDKFHFTERIISGFNNTSHNSLNSRSLSPVNVSVPTTPLWICSYLCYWRCGTLIKKAERLAGKMQYLVKSQIFRHRRPHHNNCFVLYCIVQFFHVAPRYHLSLLICSSV